MKKSDVKIGGIYRAKVSDKLTDVRIDAENPAGGWDATNLATKKKIRIKTAQRLRTASMTKTEATAVAAADQENARLRDERAASPDGKTTSERAMSGASSKKPKPKASAAKTPATKTVNKSATKPAANRLGILDAAAKILAGASEPMGCKAIVEEAMAKKLWSTNGKTPQATLYAAIVREIAKKGDESRFVKVERGRFRLNSKAKKGA